MVSQCVAAGILVVDHLCTPIDHAPAAGELIVADDLPLALGGCAANVAVDLARLGATVEIAGCVGSDPFGQYIATALSERGVGTRSLRTLTDYPTSGTLIVNVRGEDRRFIHCPGASRGVTVEQLPSAAILAAKVFYVGGFLLMPGLETPELVALLKAARAAGVKTLLDVVLPGPGKYLERLAPVLAEVDYFFPNNDEALIITGQTSVEAQAKAILDLGVGHAIITSGERGAYVASITGACRALPFRLPYVGGTGAGDAFVAGFIAGLLERLSLQECLAWASATGASCVRSISATDSVFTREELLAFLAEHPLRMEEV